MGKCYLCETNVMLTLEIREEEELEWRPNNVCPRCFIQILIENGLQESLKKKKPRRKKK